MWRFLLGTLRILSGRETRVIMEQNGFEECRRRGSRVVMQLKHPDTTLTVPVPDHKELAIETLLNTIKQSQLPRKLFEEK